MTGSIRILIADDHPTTRAALRTVLEADGFVACAEVGTGPDAVTAAVEHRPDVCLLDVRMPGGGIAAAAQISARVPETSVVMLTVSREDNDLFDALRVGAVGYLLKDTDPARLPHVLSAVVAGEAAIPRHLSARVVEEFRERSRRRRVPVVGQRAVELTSREWEVLDLMRQGLSTDAIARRLFTSQVTVRTHVAAILRKLRVRTREAALRLLDQEL